MSDEVNLNGGWTIPSYVAHNESMRIETDRRYEQRFAAQEKAVEAALTSAKEAVLKAEHASEKRFESVNEFRKTLSDQASHFMPRTEAIQRADTNAEKIQDLGSRLDRLEGRSGGLNAGWGYLIGAAGLILLALAYFTKGP